MYVYVYILADKRLVVGVVLSLVKVEGGHRKVSYGSDGVLLVTKLTMLYRICREVRCTVCELFEENLILYNTTFRDMSQLAYSRR